MSVEKSGTFATGALLGVVKNRWSHKPDAAGVVVEGETLCLLLRTDGGDLRVAIPKHREDAVRDEYRDQVGQYVTVPVWGKPLWLEGPTPVEAL